MHVANEFEKVGDVVFVYEVFFSNTGKSEMRAAKTPRRTNQSREPKLRGWCGETNNVSVTARGLARVSRVFSGTERMQLRIFPKGSKAEQEALSEVGYPDLGTT